MDGLRVKGALYVAVLAAGGVFSVLFTGEALAAAEGPAVGLGAFWTMILAAIVGLLVGSAGRYRFVLLPPCAVLYTLVAVYGMPPITPSGWRELSGEIASDVFQAANIMYVGRVPYDLAPGIFVLLVPVVVIVAAFAASATLYEESPVISVAVLGLTIGIISTLSFESGVGPFFTVFLLSSAVLLVSAGPRARRLERHALVAAVVVAVVVLALPRVSFSDAAFARGLVDWTNLGTPGTSQLNGQVDVGEYLNSARDVELLRVESTEPLLWRARTLNHFGGARWENTTEPEMELGPEIAENVPGRSVIQEVEVLNAETRWVFGGYAISRTSLPDDSVTRRPDGSLYAEEKMAEGRSYRVLSRVPQPTELQLRSAGSSYPEGIQQYYLQLPENRPQVIGETAEEILADYNTSTPYDAALAVREYLLYDGGFTYNLNADFRRADRAIQRFLGEERTGFCTQFATAMALLAREMDVPSRVVYGATTGEQVDENEYLVRGRNMHTWVEIYFPGVGWYPFDPTPGRGVTTAMQANAPRPEPQAGQQQQGMMPLNPGERARDQQPIEESPERTQSSENGAAASAGGDDSGEPPMWPVLALIPAALLAVPLSKRALLYRRRPEDLYGDLAGRLRDVLPPGNRGLADSPALTPNERMQMLAAAAGVEEEPFRRFARVYSERLYSPSPEEGASQSLSAAHRSAVRAFERLPLWRRVLGGINPASLLHRGRRRIAASKVRPGRTLGEGR